MMVNDFFSKNVRNVSPFGHFSSSTYEADAIDKKRNNNAMIFAICTP
jgi:hypothetical protein